ncbi:MAG TPA: HEPN domain-containing protein [Thermoanaerobaculia bacterium]|nr:HEPN domain-containing protein [Thermoanaerobaculia bacterium]
MISIADLEAIAAERLDEAEVLFENNRLDGAAYVCGYAVELTLKARICKTLNWEGYPEKRSEFENFSSFKTHKLDVLLALSGMRETIKTAHTEEWSAVATWDPEVRYRVVGQAEIADVRAMLQSVRTLLNVL